MKTQTRIGLALGLILALLGGLAPRAGAAGYQMPITFGGYTNRNETLTNFPVLVVFSNGVGSSGFTFVGMPFATTNGYDLRFRDASGASLNYEIESWNTNSASYVWVQVPTIATNGSTAITATWGDAARSYQMPYTTNGAVWANGYEAVWHLKDGTTLGTVKDSTTNGYTATTNGTVTAVTGRVDGAADFNGAVGSYLNTTFNPQARLGNNLTIRALVYPRTGTDVNYRGVAGDHGGSSQGLIFLQYEGSSWNCSAGLGASGWANGSPVSLALNGWNDVSAVYSNSAGTEYITAYKNGVQQTPGTKSGNISHLTTFTIGRANSANDRYFNGIVDELRVSSVARSADWVNAEYLTMASNTLFSTYGAAGAASSATYQLPIAFTNYTRAETLSNFPVLVVLSNGLGGSFNYDQFTAPGNGGDLRFTDSAGSTFLDFEFEKWDNTGASYVWVRVPQLSSNTTIYAKWGGSDTNLQASTTNGAVWDANYKMVWHLSEGVGATPYDATTNRLAGTVSGGVTQNSAGKAAAGCAFNGASGTKITASGTGLPAGSAARSMSTWIKLASTGQNNRELGGWGDNTAQDKRFAWWLTSTTLGIEDSGYAYSFSWTQDTQWHHVSVTLPNGGTLDQCSFAFDGVPMTASGTSRTLNTSTATFRMCGIPTVDGTYEFSGNVDEWRISNIARSTNWVWAEYLNMASNAFFNGYGTATAVTGPSSSPYKLPIAFTNYTRAEVLTNFPVLVTFSNGLYGTFNYNTFTSPTNGGDLRFMDSTESTYLDFEIEKWATNGASYVWVRVPQLSSNTTIYAKWGGSDTNLPACTTNGAVWANGYVGVWHLSETTGQHSDSTANKYNSSSITVAQQGTATGVAGGCDNFNGAGNSVVVSQPVPNINGYATVEAWVNGHQNADWAGMVCRSTGSVNEKAMLRSTSSGKLNFTWNDQYNNGTSAFNIPVDTWAYVAGVGDASSVLAYLNGVGATLAATAGTTTWNNGVTIGLDPYDTTNRRWIGKIDEVRVSNVARSSNWVWACYQTMASNAFFNGYGTVIAPTTATAPPQIQNQAPTGVATNGATFNGKLVTNGFENAAVYVAWGQTNGVGSGAWAYTNFWPSGAWTNGSYPSTNMALAANANYYYTFGATNSLTNVVASGYQYLITGEVTVQPTDPTGRVTLADAAVFTVYRPASCTNEALTVAYTLGGTATNATHYTNSPAATGTNGTVTIPAGQTNAVVTVYPLNVLAPQQTVVLSLVSSNYAIGSANSATCTLAAVTGYTYNDIASGNWDSTSTWTPTGCPGTNDAAVIDSHTVTANISLTNSTAPASITVSTGGTVAHASGVVVASPVTLSGGTWQGVLNPGSAMRLTGAVTVTTNSLFTGGRGDKGVWLDGPVSGTGLLTFRGVDNYQGDGADFYLTAASNTLSGGIVVEGNYAYLYAVSNQSLGTGDITVNADGRLSFLQTQDYTGAPRTPVVNLYGGSLVLGADGYSNVTVPFAVNVSASGGTFNSGGASWATGRHVTGPIAIAAGGTLNVGESRGDGWNLDGQISGAGALRFYVFDSNGGASGSVIAGTNNTHSGGTLVATFTATHTVTARGEGSLGTGPVTVETNTIMALDKTATADWTLTNTLAGAGTFKVEDGSTNYRLTAGGTVTPGTNVGAAVAVLTVTGKFAFAKSGGGTPATLAIDVATVGATPGVNHDQLAVSTGDVTLASSITNCALVVTRVPAATALNSMTLTILSAPGADFTSYTFASVSDLGSGGSVVYSNGAIYLAWTLATPVINNGVYSNLAATSCDVSGILSSTGSAPTVVRCYWGTNAIDWGYTNYLGTQSVGTVWTSLTNLTSNVKYYYRFYATNDVGEYWSVATSNFTTLGDIYWNDVANGGWKADNANTWGLGLNVYPQNALNDHVTNDSHLVSVTSATAIVAADVTLTTSGSTTGRLSFVNAAAQSQSLILDGGRLGAYSDGGGAGDVVLNGKLRVKSASVLDPGAHGNRLNAENSTLNGNIEDYGPGTTGVLRVDGSLYSGAFDAAGRLVYNGVSTNFSGGWLIQSTAAQALDGYAWFGVYQDGGLGASTVTVTRGQMNINATQSGTAPRPAPARVIVNTEGRLLIGNGVNVTNWTVDLNGGELRWNGASKYAGGTLAMNATSIWWGGATAGNKEYAGTISGAGRLDINPTGGSGPFILSGNNSGFSGGIRLLADSLTVSHTNGLGTGPVLLASQTGGKLTLDRAGGSFDWTLANNFSGGCTNGSTAVAIQVEDGVGTNTLTVLGTVDPGTNSVSGATNIASILRVDGSVAFGAGSRLRIHIAGTNGVAGVDFDRLLVDHTLTGLGNATLEVAVSSSLTPEMLNGLSFVVVSNATALASTFGSVVWSGPWQGKVVYNQPTGTVKLTGSDLGSVYKFR